jgi:hypothetical protein
MGIVIISGLATACILTAVESFLKPLGKWRGLLALIVALVFSINLNTKWLYLGAYTLAATFVGLTLSIIVEQLFTVPNARQERGLPNKVDRM